MHGSRLWRATAAEHFYLQMLTRKATINFIEIKILEDESYENARRI
jgi:hypothetical protein